MLSNRDYDLISGTLDDELTDSERAEVESRLLRDPEFAAELDAIRRTVDLVKTLPELTAPRDFRLSRAQATDITREQAQPVWRSKRPSIYTRTILPLMSAAASVLLVLGGFLSMLGGQLARQPVLNTASVAMVDATAETTTPEMVGALTQAVGAAPVDPPTLPSQDIPPGSGGGGGTSDVMPTDESEFFGGGGASEEAADTMMMMSIPDFTPSPDFESAGAARSSLAPQPTQPLPTVTESESQDAASRMFEASPIGTAPGTLESTFNAYGYESTTPDPAADTMAMQAPVSLTADSIDQDDLEGTNTTDGLADMTLATEATPKVGTDDVPPQRGISQLGGLLLVIGGVGLGVVTMILRLRNPS